MFQLQFYDSDDIVVYNGAITIFKNIRDFILRSCVEDIIFELRSANNEEKERYKKFHNENN